MQANESTVKQQQIKRKNSFLDRIFTKRAKTTSERSASNSIRRKMSTNNETQANGTAKKTKPSLDKSRKKEVKERLNAEASKEIRPLAVGTLAMMASALSNQGG